MQNYRYLTIAAPSEGLYKEKGSRFIALAYPAVSEDEIRERLHEIRKKHYDARHHCYAFRLGFDGATMHASDDGEPSGTGGRPILGQLQSHNLTNIAVFVVRYFGGIKLGVPGLINAYRSAAADAIRNAVVKEDEDKISLVVTFDYLDMNHVMTIIKEERAEIVDRHFDAICRMEIRIGRSKLEKLQSKSSFKVVIKN
ncbi:MAG: YigZ family protein [Prevotellaceae bacterium]|jgi:uncharacterized YigZ family protein|nr:YigZ family protein [Prevotellaceae bacterium]